MIAKLKRREFITLLGGAAVAWPLAARAQSADRMRRIGVLMSTTADDPEGQARIAAFQQGLQQFGWAIGHNVRIDSRWPAGDPERFRRYAAELVALSPDVILATGSAAAAPLLQATRTVPIVFVIVLDPVGAGFVNNLGAAGRQRHRIYPVRIRHQWKWLELLKQIAPGVTRAAILRDPAISAGIGQFGAIQAVAPSLGVEASPVNVRDPDEIEPAVADFARSPNGGLVITASAFAVVHPDLIITLAARYQLPAIYPSLTLVEDGGLISYGADFATNSARRRVTLTAFSRARSPPICRCRRRPSTKW